MIKHLTIILSGLFLSFTLCGGIYKDSDKRKTQTRHKSIKYSPKNISTWITGINASGVDIYKLLAKSKKNFMISPYSIGMAMSMVVTGARGETADEMRKVLHLALPREEMDTTALVLNDYFTHLNNKTLAFTIANGLCLSKEGGLVAPSYKTLIKHNYHGEVFSGGIEEINDWVSNKTNGKIKKILEETSINSVCIILNALYFKGIWRSPFDKEDVQRGLFRVNHNSILSVNVDMMTQTNDYIYLPGKNCRAVSIPYAGGNISMIIFLPREIKGLASMEKAMTAEKLSVVLKNFNRAKKRPVHLTLPKFSLNSSVDMIKVFSSLGLKTPFGMEADFGGISGKSSPPGTIYISQIVHKTTIDVDTEGSIATAATAVEDEMFGISETDTPPPPIEFRVDHPFMFLIVDNKRRTILFIGHIINPKAEK